MGTIFRVLRALRVVRVVRIIRVVRFFKELRIMVHSILNSARSPLWVIVLLTVILYISAIYLVQMVTDYRAGADADEYTSEQVSEHFGSLFEGMLYLFQAMTSGLSWGDTAARLMLIHW